MTKIQQIQQIIGMPADQQDGVWGTHSQQALDLVIHPPSIKGAFPVRIDGNDLVVDETLITCFGGWGTGIDDPSDNGGTASGMNTKSQAVIGVSVPMDGRAFPNLSRAEHAALDGSPIPQLVDPSTGKVAWHTLVQVSIDGVTYTPRDGVVDLGPNINLSKPSKPRACDLTVLAAAVFAPDMAVKDLANKFEKTGSIRIINGARLGGLLG